jgi:transcription elongation factor Elf1
MFIVKGGVKMNNKYFTCIFCDIEMKIKKEYIEEDEQGKYIRCPNCDTVQNIEG